MSEPTGRVSDDADEMACRELVERVTDYLEAALPDADRRRFEAHVAECPGCEDVLGQFRAVIVASGRLATTDVATVDPATREVLLELFREFEAGNG